MTLDILDFLGQILKIEHLDIEPDVNLEVDEIDTMIQHELNLNEDPYETMDDVGPNLDELSFPYSPQEPELSADELQRLDSIADQVEVGKAIWSSSFAGGQLASRCQELEHTLCAHLEREERQARQCYLVTS